MTAPEYPQQPQAGSFPLMDGDPAPRKPTPLETDRLWWQAARPHQHAWTLALTCEGCGADYYDLLKGDHAC